MQDVYGALLDILRPDAQEVPAVLFATLTAAEPPAVRLRGREIAGALFLPRGTRFQKEDIGREVALLPCEEGFLILCITEGG